MTFIEHGHTCDDEVSGLLDADPVAAHVGHRDPQQLLVSLRAPNPHILLRTSEEQSTRLAETKHPVCNC